MRKSHTKSRLGCRQCKQRKVKCDEARPECRRCASAGRHCSYLASLPALPTPASSLATDVPSTSPGPSHSSASTPGVRDASTTDHAHGDFHNPFFVAERYSLLHLELLLHLKSDLIDATRLVQPDICRVLNLAYREGLRVPYLMDELLALAAAHKSTLVTGEWRDSYRTESAKLQTRALSQVSLNPDVVTDDDSLALFTFSVILGQHVLFDVFSSTVDLPTMLDELVQCFDLHHGIRATASKARNKMHGVLPSDDLVDPSYLRADAQETATGTDCNGLLDRLQRSDVNQETIDEYTDTVKILQYLFDSVHFSRCRRIVVVQEWLVRVSHRYIALLRQRRPEALVVLAHYAVLLHYARDYWTVGDSGRFLISSISTHLGGYWSDWLALPKQALEGV